MIENTPAAESFDALFARLATSEFRRRFRLKAEDIAYIERKGMETIRRHAADFVRTRLAPAVIPNDGRQTRCAGIRSLSLSTPRPAAAGDVWPSGMHPARAGTDDRRTTIYRCGIDGMDRT